MLTPYFAQQLLRILSGTEYSVPDLHIGLMTDSTTEVDMPDYSRRPITITVRTSADGSYDGYNRSAVTFEAGSDWGEISHFGLFDCAEGGHLLLVGELHQHITVITSDLVRIDASDINIRFLAGG